MRSSKSLLLETEKKWIYLKSLRQMSEDSKTNSKHEHANKGNEWFERERWHYFSRGFRGVSDE